MAILNIIKKGYIHLKVGGAYIKLLPRTLATLVSMSDGRSVENAIDELNRKLPFCGRGKGTVTSNEANSLNIPVTFPTAMNNTDYVVCANLVTGSIGAFDKNYDVEVIVTKKSLTGCTLSIMRGTFGFLDYGAVLSVEYIVLPS